MLSSGLEPITLKIKAVRSFDIHWPNVYCSFQLQIFYTYGLATQAFFCALEACPTFLLITILCSLYDPSKNFFKAAAAMTALANPEKHSRY